MNKPIQLQKYCAKYEYMSLELLETKQFLEEYKKIFIDECYKLMGHETKQEDIHNSNYESFELSIKLSNDKKSESNDKSNDKSKDESKDESNDKSKDRLKYSKLLKKLYKQLSLVTHPDKQNGTDELFKIVKEAYDKNDIFKLITIAVKFKIEIKEVIDSTLWDDEILKMKNQIDYSKNTYAWLWVNASEKEKQKLIEKIMLHKK